MTRILVILVGLGLGLALALGGVAAAQPAQPMPRAPGLPIPIQPQRVQPPAFAKPGAAAPQRETTVNPHGDTVESSGPGMALLFWLFAFVAVGGALFVVTRKNLIAAVMGMVGGFLGIAAIYMMLYANFLAVLQMLVYAGAIMVLFVFVIMILNRPEDEPVAPTGRAGAVFGSIAILYLIGRLVMMLIHVTPPDERVAMEAPAAIQLPATTADEPGESVGWGSVKAVGNDLFGPGLFPFEAISILLLVAVVGAIAIARPLKDDQQVADQEPAGEAH
ncbi:MAG TPA: NADH-quinone oxidoreductase subunit J [Kofleriaceae bacterium]|nr:NADH-quinone oxidoreductase subunit J [Kofleriaceae bacterium]